MLITSNRIFCLQEHAVMYIKCCIFFINNILSADLMGKNSTMMTMMRFVVDYSPEIAEAAMTMLQNATMVNKHEKNQIFAARNPLSIYFGHC